MVEPAGEHWIKDNPGRVAFSPFRPLGTQHFWSRHVPFVTHSLARIFAFGNAFGPALCARLRTAWSICADKLAVF